MLDDSRIGARLGGGPVKVCTASAAVAGNAYCLPGASSHDLDVSTMAGPSVLMAAKRAHCDHHLAQFASRCWGRVGLWAFSKVCGSPHGFDHGRLQRPIAAPRHLGHLQSGATGRSDHGTVSIMKECRADFGGIDRLGGAGLVTALEADRLL